VSGPARAAPPGSGALAIEAWELTAVEPPPRILDLREPPLFARAHLPGARNLPYGRFQAEALPACGPGAAPVVVVCAGGARSAEMAVWLRARGVAARYLVGGMAAWTGPLAQGAPPGEPPG
jgi:rhodanese-related sulfurtransferase